MIIKALELRNYRNYAQACINFDPKTNILYGKNGQGKTNILESVYLCGVTKSHRGNKDKELIKFDENESHIKCLIEKDKRERRIDIHLKKGMTKGIAIDKIPIKKYSELFGLLNIVLFSPEDLSIIKNGPLFRRRFMDSELCQSDGIYLHNLTMFRKALDQRNSLLKTITYEDTDKSMLDIWDEKVVEYGMNIIDSRKKFINKINPVITDIHKEITGNNEILDVTYEENVSASDYPNMIKSNREKDIRFGQTHSGPHKDDLAFVINGVDMRKYGSQGQQRTCALALKLAEIEIIKEISGDEPVLLLDDVLSELDSDRQKLLLKYIHDTQTIITCTGMDDFIKNNFDIDKIYKIDNGNVYVENVKGV